MRAIWIIALILAGEAYAKGPKALVESAPLKQILGQTSLRGEFGFSEQFHGGMFGEAFEFGNDQIDRISSLGGEVVWYEKPYFFAYPYLAGGVLGERYEKTESRQRPYGSERSYDYYESQDHWRHTGMTLRAMISGGVRVSVYSRLTLSLRYNFAPLLGFRNETKGPAEGSGAEEKSYAPSRLRQWMTLYLGVILL